MSALAERYAKGALAAAGSPEAGEALVADLEKFTRSMADNAKLTTALTHPGLKNQRAQVVSAVGEALGLQSLAHKVLGLLVHRDRITSLAAITACMRELTDAQAGRLRAQIVSAMPMTAEQVTALTGALSKRLGKPVTAQVRVDKALIGGMVCEVGNLTFDNSLKNQLALMAEQLGARAH
jgi:F-type H+-transporting ATPase subunit delta